jgi:hypothetical protein
MSLFAVRRGILLEEGMLPGFVAPNSDDDDSDLSEGDSGEDGGGLGAFFDDEMDEGEEDEDEDEDEDEEEERLANEQDLRDAEEASRAADDEWGAAAAGGWQRPETPAQTAARRKCQEKNEHLLGELRKLKEVIERAEGAAERRSKAVHEMLGEIKDCKSGLPRRTRFWEVPPQLPKEVDMKMSARTREHTHLSWRKRQGIILRNAVRDGVLQMLWEEGLQMYRDDRRLYVEYCEVRSSVRRLAANFFLAPPQEQTNT